MDHYNFDDHGDYDSAVTLAEINQERWSFAAREMDQEADADEAWVLSRRATELGVTEADIVNADEEQASHYRYECEIRVYRDLCNWIDCPLSF